jgi:hypothetical protein
MCSVTDHQRRFSTMFTALYEDLGIVAPGSAGRDKEAGKYA